MEIRARISTCKTAQFAPLGSAVTAVEGLANSAPSALVPAHGTGEYRRSPGVSRQILAHCTFGDSPQPRRILVGNRARAAGPGFQPDIGVQASVRDTRSRNCRWCPLNDI